MSNKKQTSVDWLMYQLEMDESTLPDLVKQVLKQAQDLHKQEIMNAYAEGAENEFAMGKVSRSDYYNNTYGKV